MWLYLHLHIYILIPFERPIVIYPDRSINNLFYSLLPQFIEWTRYETFTETHGRNGPLVSWIKKQASSVFVLHSLLNIIK